MAYKDKRSRPGLYYGSDGLIKDPSDPTGKRWIEDPKTFVPVKKASNSVNVDDKDRKRRNRSA